MTLSRSESKAAVDFATKTAKICAIAPSKSHNVTLDVTPVSMMQSKRTGARV